MPADGQFHSVDEVRRKQFSIADANNGYVCREIWKHYHRQVLSSNRRTLQPCNVGISPIRL